MGGRLPLRPDAASGERPAAARFGLPLHRLPAHDRQRFSLTLTIPSSGFEVTAGEPVIGGLHGPTRHYFCPHCLSWVFTRPEGFDEFVNLRATTLDDHPWFVPFIEVWTQEKLPWAQTPAIHSFAIEPALDDYFKLAEEFARDGARP